MSRLRRRLGRAGQLPTGDRQQEAARSMRLLRHLLEPDAFDALRVGLQDDVGVAP